MGVVANFSEELSAVLGLHALPKSAERELRMGYQIQQRIGIERQRRINADARKHVNRMADGIGERFARVDASVYFGLAGVYGRECWDDKDFMHDCMKRGLVQRERSRADKTTIRVNGLNARQGTGRIVTANRFGGV
jgi:hypothetical protein